MYLQWKSIKFSLKVIINNQWMESSRCYKTYSFLEKVKDDDDNSVDETDRIINDKYYSI